VLRDKVGEVGRPPALGSGGGVSDKALGLLYADGDGDMAGEDMSGAGRHADPSAVSSSDARLGSNSFSREETRGGSLLSRSRIRVLEDEPFVALPPRPRPTPLLLLLDDAAGAALLAEATAAAAVAGAAGEDAEFDISPWVGKRRVRGRFSLRSGS
jgi:hypothetical protein